MSTSRLAVSSPFLLQALIGEQAARGIEVRDAHFDFNSGAVILTIEGESVPPTDYCRAAFHKQSALHGEAVLFDGLVGVQ